MKVKWDPRKVGVRNRAQSWLMHMPFCWLVKREIPAMTYSVLPIGGTIELSLLLFYLCITVLPATHTQKKKTSFIRLYNQITTSQLKNNKCATASPLLSLVFTKSKKCFILSWRPLRPQSDKVPEPAGPVNQSMSPQGLQGEAEQKTGQIVEGTTYLAEWLATYGTSFADPKWSVNYNSRGRLFHKKNRFLRVQDQMAVTKMNDSGDYY